MSPVSTRGLGCVVGCALLVGACPGPRSVDPCPEPPGCPGQCCTEAVLCSRAVCDGAEYTCVRDRFTARLGWVPGRPQCASGGDGPGLRDARPRDAASRPERPGCVCLVNTTRPCGPCNAGTQACKADCSGYETQCNVPSGVCQAGTAGACPNDCGTRTCSTSCAWGACSKAGQLVKVSGKGCWSSNHCPAGSPGGTGRCVDCWLGCNADGTTYEDTWCAGTKCQTCSPVNVSCN